MEEKELYIVTEQGMFGDLDLAKDPSKKKVLSKEELDKLIKERQKLILKI